MAMGDVTTVPLKKSTRDRLKQWGRKGETYDQLLNRMLDDVEAKRVVAFEPLDE